MTMYRGKIENAKREAEDFIGARNEALARLDKEVEQTNRSAVWRNEQAPTKGPSIADYSYGSAETGALRRKSMDLTRTLADLRK